MELQDEEWRDAVGWEYYRVSSIGRVMSKERKVRHVSKNGKESFIVVRPKILHPHISKRFGYAEISLYDGINREKKVKVHRLVAEAFIPNPANLPQVNHKNEVRNDNRVENLEWCTAAYNLNYNGGRGKRDITHSKPILAYYPNGVLYMEFWSALSAAKHFGVCRSAIQKAAKYGQKSRTGFTFKYKETNETD